MTRWTTDDLKAKGFDVSGDVITRPKIAGPMPDRILALGRMKGRKMNKTEATYGRLLEARKQVGEVLWYEFEPLNLRLADNTYYRIDWLVLMADCSLEVHETKGGYVTDDSLVKFKVAASIFPFRFRMFSLKKGEWKELYAI